MESSWGSASGQQIAVPGEMLLLPQLEDGGASQYSVGLGSCEKQRRAG